MAKKAPDFGNQRARSRPRRSVTLDAGGHGEGGVGRAGGSTGPVKYTNRISEIGEGALTRWSAEFCAYLPAGAFVNDASTRLRDSSGQSVPLINTG
jgi:hypothetical protein